MTGTGVAITPLANGVYVSSDTTEMVRNAIGEGRDPLGVGTSMDSAYTGNLAESTVNAALIKLTPGQAKAIEADLRDTPPGKEAALNMVGVDLLVAMGLDPLTVWWLAGLDTSLFIYDSETYDDIVSFDGQPHGGEIRISDDVSWRMNGALDVRGLPDIVVTAACGRPLRDIVSHPVLDQHDLLITQAEGMKSLVTPAQLTCARRNLDGSAVKRADDASLDTAVIQDLITAHDRLVRG